MESLITKDEYLEIPNIYIDFIKDLKELDIETYVTGGAIRNFLLGYDYVDIDLFCRCKKETFLSKIEVDVIVDFDNVLIFSYGCYGSDVFTVSLSISFYESFKERDYTINSFWYCPLKCEIFGYEVSFDDISKKLLRPCRDGNLNTITVLRALRFWDNYYLKPSGFWVYDLKIDTIDTRFKALRLKNELKKHKTSNLIKYCMLHQIVAKLLEFQIEV